MRGLSASAIALIAATLPMAASAESISMGNPYAFRSDRTANPLGFLRNSIVIGVNNVLPNPVNNPGPADGNQTSVIARQAGTEVSLFRIAAAPGSGLENTYIRQIDYDPNLTGVWEVTASNPIASIGRRSSCTNGNRPVSNSRYISVSSEPRHGPSTSAPFPTSH